MFICSMNVDVVLFSFLSLSVCERKEEAEQKLA